MPAWSSASILCWKNVSSFMNLRAIEPMRPPRVFPLRESAVSMATMAFDSARIASPFSSFTARSGSIPPVISKAAISWSPEVIR